MNREQVIALMKSRQGERTAKEFAEELGISTPYLSDVYSGRRDPGESILSRLNLRMVKMYEVLELVA